VVIALGGGLPWWQRQQRIAHQPPAIDNNITMQPNLDLSTLSNEMLLALAQKEKNNWQSLAAIATELLNQQAMPQAKVVIYDIAIAEQANRAELNFLKGRYAWQMALQDPQGDYSFDDVRRFWLQAHEEDPKQFNYLSAVGFAYYAEGNYEEASKIWSEVTMEIDLNPVISAQSNAGLALTLHQEAKTKTGEAQKSLESKVGKLQKTAIALAPQQMSTEALAQNWLWSEKAIADWQELLAAQANE
jgi:tetratricopeptide (TPR) repeat protein